MGVSQDLYDHFLLATVRPDFSEMTALGAAIAAGLAAGVWKDTTQLPKAKTTVSEPTVTADGKRH